VLAALDRVGFDASSASRPATDEPMRSLSAVASARVSALGAANERSTDSGRPASEPGV